MPGRTSASAGTSEFAGGFALRDLPDGWRVGQFASLTAQRFPHAVTTRIGGVFPAGPAGQQAAAEELTRRFELAGVSYARQVHGAQCLVVSQPGLAGEADALVCQTPGLAVAGFSADCPLILLADPTSGAVGVAHASWRGTAARIAGRAVRAMADRFAAWPEDLLAGICPSAGPCCYEVGPDLIAEMVSQLGPDRAVTYCRHDRAAETVTFDLWQANADELRLAGVPAEQISLAGVCSLCRNDLFASYRVEGDRAGRFCAAIAPRGPSR